MPERKSLRADTLWLAIMHAHFAIDLRARESIEDTGLCYSDFSVLESLLHRGALPVNAIAKEIHLTSGSMTTSVDRLEKRGLVERTANPDDGRSRLVELTEAGRRLIETAYARHAADLEALVGSALAPSERAQLFALLRRLEHAAKRGAQ